MPEPSAFGVRMTTERLKGHESSATDKIPAELIKVDYIKIRSEIHKLVNYIWLK